MKQQPSNAAEPGGKGTANEVAVPIVHAGRLLLAEIAIASGLLAWRVFSQAPKTLWQDWIALLSLYWIYSALKSKSSAWPVVTLTLMASLFGLYAVGQFPHILKVLALTP